MKRALLVSILTALGLAAVACSESGDTLTTGEGKETDKDATETPPSTKKSDTNSPVNPPANTPAPAPQKTTTPAPATPTDCSTSADLQSCAKCCATNAAGGQNNPANACACAAGAKCADKCTGNLCDGKMPNIECALCVAQSDCDFGFGGDDGNGGGAQDSPAAQCLQQCGTKFGQQP